MMEIENTYEIMHLAEQVINQSHYSNLSDFKILELDETSRSIPAEDVLCLFKISEIVYDEDATTDKFSVVFNALHACGASCIMILECIEGKSELYLGAVNKQRYENIYYLSVIRDIIKSGIQGNLPGSEIKEVVSRRDIKKVLHNALNSGFDSQCITSVSCVAGASSDEKKEKKSEHGIESLLGAVRESNFSIIVIADPVSNDQLDIVKIGYEDLGSSLSSLESSSTTVQTGSNYTTAENTSTSFNESLSKGLSYSQSHSFSGVYQKDKTLLEALGGAVVQMGAGGVAALTSRVGNKLSSASTAMGISSSVANPILGALSTRKETAITEKNAEIEKIEAQTNRTYSLANDSFNDSTTKQKGTSINESKGVTEQVGQSTSLTQNESTSIQKTTKNLHIANLNEKLGKYLKWLNRSRNYGMFNCCTYIVSGSASTNLFVAGQYQALIQSYGESEQPVSINTWTKENGVEDIRNSLIHLVHPLFESPSADTAFSPAMLMSSNELSKQMSLPRKSIVGVSVAKHAAFGIEVVRKSNLRKGSLVRIGEVQHMGKKTGQPVLLDLQSLSSHAFIAGTNGSGKSNTVFKIIEELMRLDLPFMVIEPAKGEYKNLFGNDPNVTVYGTNPKKTKLLNINPFWFNDDVTVHEHIDKLIEIFNASWSMSAAMPAVLKASIENAYKTCGWNLKTSECIGQKTFPTVKDVLNEFNNKMQSTAFSEEVKGNYVGALSTRMESLCNGIYEEIFLGENLEDEALFDSNVLIDLSRVGSSETKSMIMGFLLIRLQEYRMQTEALNLPLKHITILEEAHHLLRSTSSAQTSEGTNMLGKSVEMISNMIAEMRSYGEGFMIVDQSPGLLDMSVMRNTNTKIIMRLLESGDREMVGNTIGMNMEQCAELSRLKTGVCAIYQKEWLEPVLCMVDKASHEESIYTYTPPADKIGFQPKLIKARGIAFETITPLKPQDPLPDSEIEMAVKTLEASHSCDKQLSGLLSKHFKEKTTRQNGTIEPYASIIWELLDGDNNWDYYLRLISEMNLGAFDSLIREQIAKYIDCSEKTQTSIISLFLQKKGGNQKVSDFYYKWAWKFIYNRGVTD